MKRFAPTRRHLIAVVALIFLCAPPAFAVVEEEDKPKFRLKTIDGRSLQSNQLHGAIVIIDFWSTASAESMQRMPNLIRLQRDLKARGLMIIGISMDPEPDPVIAVAGNHTIPFAIAVDSQQAKPLGPDWGITKPEHLPLAFLLSPDGEVLWRGDPAEIEDTLASVLEHFPDARYPDFGESDKVNKKFQTQPLTEPQLAEANKLLTTVRNAVQKGDYVTAFGALAKLPVGATDDERVVRMVKPTLFMIGQIEDATRSRTTAHAKARTLAADPRLPEKKKSYQAALKAHPKGVANYRLLVDYEKRVKARKKRATTKPASATTQPGRRGKSKDRSKNPKGGPPAAGALKVGHATSPPGATGRPNDMFVDAAASDPAAARSMKSANRAIERGKHMEAYRRLARIVLRFPDAAEADLARRKIAEYDADVEFAKKYRDAEIERQAKSLLSMARNYQANDRGEFARGECKKLIEQFPGTKWATEAQTLLNKLDSKKSEDSADSD
ncbi:MAG: hypothetical protein CMJ49_05450 [Planctomycetaceae bacterium]|nr:hypothetical protein [Planctomycetaceae bacterium]